MRRAISYQCLQLLCRDCVYAVVFLVLAAASDSANASARDLHGQHQNETGAEGQKVHHRVHAHLGLEEFRGWLTWSRARRAWCTKLDTPRKYKPLCSSWLRSVAYSDPAAVAGTSQLDLTADARIAVAASRRRHIGSCTDIDDTMLEDDEQSQKLQCEDLRNECQNSSEPALEYIKAICPVTCGACRAPCRDVNHTTLTGTQGQELSCPDVKHLCYKGDMGSIVVRLCPITCGLCSRAVPFVIRNSTNSVRHALKMHLPLWDASLSIPSRLSRGVEPWRIPGILHQTWKTDQMPVKFAWHLASWRRLHPHWDFEFWDDRRTHRLVIEEFPRYADAFAQMPGIKKADVGRIVTLYVYGGIYADIDVEAARSLEPLLEAAAQARAGVLLGEENTVHTILLERRFSEQLVSNAVMASSPRHPFWLEVLKEIFGNKNCGDDPVLCTGPRLVDRFSLQQTGCGANGCVIRLPFDYWYPQIAHWNSDAMRNACHQSIPWADHFQNGKIRKSIKKACQMFEEVVQYPSALQTDRTFAIHKWQCSWCREDSALKRTVPLSHVVYQVGNETLDKLCHDRVKKPAGNSLSALLPPLSNVHQGKLVMAQSYRFKDWFYDAYPKACSGRKRRRRGSHGIMNPSFDVVDDFISSVPHQQPNSTHNLRRSFSISFNMFIMPVSGRTVAFLAAGSSFAVAIANKVDATLRQPGKVVLPT